MQKQYRLTQNSSFNYIYKRGKSVSAASMILYRVPAHNLKVGITVGKKVGNSVVRSRVKRRIKERFRLLIPMIDNNYNYVIVAKKECAELKSEEINKALIYLLKKAGVLSEEEVAIDQIPLQESDTVL